MESGELETTAELALLELSDDERQNLELAVSQLLEYFTVMETLDVSDLQPTTHALSEHNRLRPDEASHHASLADDILEQSPDLEDRLIAIPNVL